MLAQGASLAAATLAFAPAFAAFADDGVAVADAAPVAPAAPAPAPAAAALDVEVSDRTEGACSLCIAIERNRERLSEKTREEEEKRTGSDRG